jgi:hypothetical protein
MTARPGGVPAFFDLHQEVELTLVPQGRAATAVIEWQRRGTHFSRAHSASSPERARAWIEGCYEDVEWDRPVHARALIGRLVGGTDLIEDP